MHKVTAWRQRMKQKAINFKGGKCQACGYEKCAASLEFHHIDPRAKEFKLCSKNCISWARMKKELTKCVLLCANCHREAHFMGG